MAAIMKLLEVNFPKPSEPPVPVYDAEINPYSTELPYCEINPSPMELPYPNGNPCIGDPLSAEFPRRRWVLSLPKMAMQ